MENSKENIEIISPEAIEHNTPAPTASIDTPRPENFVELRLSRDYAFNEDKYVILTEEEQKLADKYNLPLDIQKDPYKTDQSLEFLKEFDSKPLEERAQIAKDLQANLDKTYCNPDDPKNQPSNNMAVRGITIASNWFAKIVPGIGNATNILVQSTLDRNSCEPFMKSVVKNTTNEIKNVGFGSAGVAIGVAELATGDLGEHTANAVFAKNDAEKEIENQNIIQTNFIKGLNSGIKNEQDDIMYAAKEKAREDELTDVVEASNTTPIIEEKPLKQITSPDIEGQNPEPAKEAPLQQISQAPNPYKSLKISLNKIDDLEAKFNPAINMNNDHNRRPTMSM